MRGARGVGGGGAATCGPFRFGARARGLAAADTVSVHTVYSRRAVAQRSVGGAVCAGTGYYTDIILSCCGWAACDNNTPRSAAHAAQGGGLPASMILNLL